ncbi:hypothetical protein OS493_010484 [Desmophyllum pertusum]|uniref:Uncharacterized protein n=1 Tax=Desmophyllum pertusum TaxID=174260 RepID=A0A9X0A4V4_9CNID|nr:hypothetical protein OS493_010484 [Desmophyllum pertusum]
MMTSSGEEDPGEKKQKLDLLERNRGAKKHRSARDRVDRDFEGDRHASRQEYDSRGEHGRDVRGQDRNREREIHERDRETRNRERDIHERDRDRETRNRDIRERDVDGARDRDYRDNHDRHATDDRREQRDRALYHPSRDDRDREVDERRRDRVDKRRDHREDEDRAYERRDRNDYSDRKDRR